MQIAKVGPTYFVAHSVWLADGIRLHSKRLSRPIGRMGVLKRVAKRILRHHPDAYLLTTVQLP